VKLIPILVAVALGIAVLVGLWVALSDRSEPTPTGPFPVLDSTEGSADPASTGAGGAAQATFGSGCFWCTEAVFGQVKGVKSVVSGYSGGSVVNPSYEQVCSGRTGHAEVIHLTYDPRVVSYATLLEVFWRSHDPTTLNQQGHDHGTQYRSVIFYYTERQRELAEEYKRKIDAAGVFRSPVVTEIVPAAPFYPAEVNHQDYYARNARQPYCQAVITPKLDKLREVFADRLKSE